MEFKYLLARREKKCRFEKEISQLVVWSENVFKINESRYRRCGVTLHFRKLKNTCQNFGEAGGAITINNNSMHSS